MHEVIPRSRPLVQSVPALRLSRRNGYFGEYEVTRHPAFTGLLLEDFTFRVSGFMGEAPFGELTLHGTITGALGVDSSKPLPSHMGGPFLEYLHDCTAPAERARPPTPADTMVLLRCFDGPTRTIADPAVTVSNSGCRTGSRACRFVIWVRNFFHEGNACKQPVRALSAMFHRSPLSTRLASHPGGLRALPRIVCSTVSAISPTHAWSGVWRNDFHAAVLV